jgi:hypothetical protein
MHDEAAVDTAGEEGAQWHIGDELVLDGLRQQTIGLDDERFMIGRAFRRIGDRPPLAHRRAAAWRPAQAAARRQGMDVAHQRTWRQRCLEGEVVAQSFGVKLLRKGVQSEERRQCRRRDQAAPMFAPEQRLDAEPVAGEKDAAVAQVVDGEGEHAIELFHH